MKDYKTWSAHAKSLDTTAIESVPTAKTETDITQDLAENQDFYTLFDYNCYDDYGNYSGSAYSIEELTHHTPENR